MADFNARIRKYQNIKCDDNMMVLDISYDPKGCTLSDMVGLSYTCLIAQT